MRCALTYSYATSIITWASQCEENIDALYALAFAFCRSDRPVFWWWLKRKEEKICHWRSWQTMGRATAASLPLPNLHSSFLILFHLFVMDPHTHTRVPLSLSLSTVSHVYTPVKQLTPGNWEATGAGGVCVCGLSLVQHC